jgi:hypothetical protein
MSVVFVPLAAVMLFALRWFGRLHDDATERFIAGGAGRPGTPWFVRRLL